MIEIDGSEKSGSGTLVRDAASFCALRRENLRIRNIRAKRPNPGLRAQHLKALEAVAQLCNGRLTGAAVGSKDVSFFPGRALSGGDYEWAIGTAGSAIMLALTVLPLGLFADRPSRYRITGGLFQDFAPPAFHFQHVLLPVLRRMGITAEAVIIRPGYVPRGQGVIEIRVDPAKKSLKPLSMTEQGKVTRVSGIALSSRLRERKVAEKMAAACRKALAARRYELRIDVLYDDRNAPAYDLCAIQAGAALAVWAETVTGCRIGADMAGARGRSSEFIGTRTALSLLEDLDTGAAVDRHLADQLVPFAGLAAGQSAFSIPGRTAHVESRMWLAGKMLGAGAQATDRSIRIQGIGMAR
jgi:RNA 3'-terminal phosphate cyclase (ATP)